MKHEALLSTPVGEIKLTFYNELLTKIELNNTSSNSLEVNTKFYKHIKEVSLQLEEYFCGERRFFTFSYHLIGTSFDIKCWEAISRISYGNTVSYGELAEELGNIRAARAVARACKRNPLPIVIPCHRVVGKKSIGGYSFGGIRVKKFLIQLERKAKLNL